MIHEMHLKKKPFERISGGHKTIELRLNDEKRKNIKVGDVIRFFYEENKNVWVDVKVVALYMFDSFQELYKSLSLLKCGYTKEDIDSASYQDMEKYYSKEKQKQYGVLGIEFELVVDTLYIN